MINTSNTTVQNMSAERRAAEVFGTALGLRRKGGGGGKGGGSAGFGGKPRGSNDEYYNSWGVTGALAKRK